MNAPSFTRPDHGLPDMHAGRRLLACYHTTVLGLAVAILYANLPIYGYVLNPGLLPKYLYFAMFCLLAPLVLAWWRALGAYLSSPFVLWACLLLLVNLIHVLAFADSASGGFVLLDDHLEARRALILTRVQYILFALVLGFGFFTSTSKSFLAVTVVLAVLLPGAVVLDFAQPGLLYPVDTAGAVLGRAGAMFINPTMAGEAILLVFLFSCAVTPVRYRGLLYLLAGAGVLATFSRSSIIAWALLLPMLVYWRTLPRSTLAVTALILAMIVLYLGAFERYLDSRQEFEAASSNILARLDFFSSFEFKDDSSEERAAVLRAGWDLFLQNPVFGAGAGATLFWEQRGSTHNQLLLFAAEYGCFGIGLWLWLLAILWRGRFFEDRALQCSMAFLFAFMSMFTHQMLDAASYWLAAFALASLAPNGANSAGPAFSGASIRTPERPDGVLT